MTRSRRRYRKRGGMPGETESSDPGVTAGATAHEPADDDVENEDLRVYTVHSVKIEMAEAPPQPVGSVLWVSGDTKTALAVLQGAVARDPDHSLLVETMERLGVPQPTLVQP